MKQRTTQNLNLTHDKKSSVSLGKRTIKKRIASLASFCLLISTPVFATIPAPMQKALNQANISVNDVSLIITPVKGSAHNSSLYNNSRLAPIIDNNMSKIKDTEAVEIALSNTISTKTNNRTTNSMVSESHKLSQPLNAPIHHNPNTPRTPASTMKLITTFIALDLLGSDFKWMTHVYHTGYILKDTLHGNLIIKGSGDPKLTHSRLETLLSKVGDAGIRHINGDIILDASVFKNVTKDPAAFDNEPLRSYNASPDGFLVNFNSIEINTVLKPDDISAANVYYVPQMADYNLPSKIPTRGGSCGALRKKIAPDWTDDGLVYGKALPVACGLNKTMYIAHPNAKEFASHVTKHKWLMLGNTLKGNVISTETPSQTTFGLYTDRAYFELGSDSTKGNRTKGNNVKGNNAKGTPTTMIPILATASPLPMVSYPSLPLSEQIYDINHYSNNVMTEQVLLSLPFSNALTDNQNTQTSANPDKPYKQALSPLTLLNMPASNYDKSLAKVNDWWQTHLTTSPPYLTNGSGLCRSCRLTANNLAELLEYAYHHLEFATYASSMGIAGISGTIEGHRRRLPNSAALGHALIKTGTLDNVTAMAGYVQGQSGQDYIVVGIINTPDKLNTTKARYVLDTMLDWTARQ